MKLSKLLDIRPGITALIGGGGKTSLMYRLAAELEGTVLVCTTTKIWPPDHIPVVQDAESLRRAFAAASVVCAGTPNEQGKLTEPSFPWRDAADYILVEADGSAGRPCKAHAPWEPVLPADCRTILVVGASGFGQPIAQAAHRPERYAALIGVTTQQCITPAMAAQVIDRERLHRQVFLNQVDTAEAWAQAEEFAAHSLCPVAAGSLWSGIWKRMK